MRAGPRFRASRPLAAAARGAGVVVAFAAAPLAWAACGESPSRQGSAGAAASASGAPAPATPAPPPATLASRCDEIRAHNEAVVDEFRRSAAEPPLGFQRPPLDGACARHEGRAWAAVVRDFARDDPGPGWYLEWQLVYVEPDGARVLGGPGFNERSSTPSTAGYIVGDFDLDGAPEIVLKRTWEHPEGPSGYALESLTAKRGAVTNFSFPYPFDELKDVDGDGHPDGILSNTAEEKMCQWGWEETSGPPLVVRFVPGRGFDLGDPFTRQRARAACPSAPRAVVVKRRERGAAYIDDRQTARNAVCARVWGRDPAAIESELESECTTFGASLPEGVSGDDCTKAIETRRPGECRHREKWAAWAQSTPPILRASAPPPGSASSGPRPAPGP